MDYNVKEFEKIFLQMVQQVTQNLHILEHTNEMFSAKNVDPIHVATNLAFRTMVEPYLDRNSSAVGYWWLSKLYAEAPVWIGNGYEYVTVGQHSCVPALRFQMEDTMSSPLCLPMEIYRVFQSGWPDILNEALDAFVHGQEDSSGSALEQRSFSVASFPDAVQEKLRNLLRNTTGDIDQGLRLLLSTFMQNIEIEVIDAISCEKYEGSSTKCQLAVITDCEGLMPFDAGSQLPFTVENVRALRKQAEMGSGEMCLAVSRKGGGLRTQGLIPLKRAFCPIIFIDRPMSWRFSLPSNERGFSAEHDSQRKFSVQFCRNAYSFSLPPLADEMESVFFHQLCQKHFKKQSEAEFESLRRVVSHLRQNAYRFHGTSILIAENAEAESTRLCDKNHRGYRLKKDFIFEAEKIIPYLAHLASIDGAIILSPAGKCEGFATILDGKATTQAPGNPARGARYNSARAYLYNIKGAAVAVVISTDGSVDYLQKVRAARTGRK